MATEKEIEARILVNVSSTHERRAVARGQTAPGKTLPENSPEALKAKGDARDQAAARFGVSGVSVDQAEVVLKKGSPELIAKVERGELGWLTYRAAS